MHTQVKESNTVKLSFIFVNSQANLPNTKSNFYFENKGNKDQILDHFSKETLIYVMK